MMLEEMKPIIQNVVQDIVTSSDATYTQDAVTMAIIDILGPLVNKGIAERQKLLDEKKEAQLNKIVQSTINEMWPVATQTIQDSPLDTYNIEKSTYGQMVHDLIPELIKSTNYSGIHKVLGYPVIKDELNIIIRKKNVSCSVQELTDKIFSKLVRTIINNDIQYLLYLHPLNFV